MVLIWFSSVFLKVILGEKGFRQLLENICPRYLVGSLGKDLKVDCGAWFCLHFW